MRHIQILSLLLAVMLSQGIYANESSDSSYKEKERQTRELAQEVLNGREVIVRVYSYRECNPPEYTKVSVLLEGLSFKHAQIKAALPDINEPASLVIVSSDQTDPAVASVLGNYVSSNILRAEGGHTIWPKWSQTKEYQYLLFVDALGNPIPNANVEVQVCLESIIGFSFDELIDVPVGTAVLDSNGRYFSPIWGNVAYGMNFIISHPNYGIASVQSHRSRDISNVYVMPFVPLDSEAANRSFQGYVVDDKGEPVTSLPIHYDIRLKDNDLKKYEPTNSLAVTDEKGWFSIYAPLEWNDELYTEIVPKTAKYEIRINPPKSFNMFSYDSMRTNRGGFPVGEEPKKITLQSMNPDQYFHTLIFQDDQRVIDDPAMLEKITITVHKENRMWQRLTYNEFKDGCYLYEGTLYAQIERENRRFSFQPIKLTEESSQELVLKMGQEKIYRGMVIDATTGLPASNVLVLANNVSLNKDELEKLYSRIDELRSRAMSEASQGLSEDQLYEPDNRVALTDRYGYYLFDFRTGLSNELSYFTALDKNYYALPVHTGTGPKPQAKEVIDVPVIELLPPQAKYSPVLIFEDAAGNAITDPNILENIWLKRINNEGGEREGKYKSIIIEQLRIEYGTYYATLNYGEFNYVYEPVVINWESPREIFFKLKEVKDREIVLKGRVVHGITDEPMSEVIVFVNDSSSFGQPPLDDIAKYQDIVSSIGDDFDPDNPAVQMLNQALNSVSITRTDRDGGFELRVDRQYKSNDPMSYIMAIEKNFMSAKQSFRYMLPIDKDSPEPVRLLMYEPDEDGVIRFSEMRLFPSAQIILELNLPDMSRDGQDRTRVQSYYRTAPDDPTPWLKKFWATPRERMGAGIVRQSGLRPNGRQAITVPAGVKLSLIIYTLQDERTGIIIDGIKLEQGQSLDLGLVEFPPTLKVYVKLIDSQENPVQDVLVNCTDSSGVYFGQRAYSNEEGIAVLYVTPDSKGEFSVSHRDNETNELIRESIPYEVHGEEDAGTEFILQLSDEILFILFESGEAL